MHISVSTFWEVHDFFHMFDWFIARKYGLLWIIRQYWLLRSHVGEEWAENMTKLLKRYFLNSDRIDQLLRWKVLKVELKTCQGQTLEICVSSLFCGLSYGWISKSIHYTDFNNFIMNLTQNRYSIQFSTNSCWISLESFYKLLQNLESDFNKLV